MNSFSENPLFLFVDDLADGSPNFATDGKIVELFDTGCDARTPGGAFKVPKEPEAAKGSPQILNVRKPFSLSLRQDKTEVKKNTSPVGTEDQRQNIAGRCKSPKQNKPMTWNPKPKDKVPIKNDGAEVKTGLDPLVGNKSSKYSKRVIGPEQNKTKSNVTRIGMYSNYGGRNRTEKLQSISSSIPKQCKAPEAGQTIFSTFVTTSPTKTSKLTSEASSENGFKKFVNRAVDKDSLSNCSRQLEVAKNPGTSSSLKTGYASRLPRSAGAAKFICRGNPPSGSPVLIGIGKEAKAKPDGKLALMKIVGGTDHEHQDKGLQSKAIKTEPTVSPGKRRDRLEGETTSRANLNASPKAKLPTKIPDFDDRNPLALSPSRSKITPSKVPLPRFGRNLLIGAKNAQKPGYKKEKSQVDRVCVGQKPEFNEGLQRSKIYTDEARCRDSDNLLTSERPSTYSEKVPARPSAKCHNLTPHKKDANNTAISFESKLPKPGTPSIVPKLFNEFQIQERKRNEVSKFAPRSMARSMSLGAKVESGKTKTDMNGKQPSTPGSLSNQLNERVSRFSYRVQEVLSSKTPLLGKVTESIGSDHRSVDRGEQNKSKVDPESISLSGVKAVHEDDEEVELRTIFEDSPVPASRKPTAESSPSSLKPGITKELKLRDPPLRPLATESKVPRPVVPKFIPRKEMARNLPERNRPKKQEPSTLRGPSKSPVKSCGKTEAAKPSTPQTKKSVDHVPESNNVAKDNEDEDVIPIMNPALYNIRSFATHYRERGNLQDSVPRGTVHRGKLESWIEGHEQAYLRGRAIGLKVASMARAAKDDLKREFVRSGLRSTKPMSLPDKSQEIVDIGISVIEKVLAEKENKIHSPSLRGDQVLNYHDFDKNTEWNNGQWFVS